MATEQIDDPKQEDTADLKVADTSKDEWDEAQLEAGLKILKEMHIQLRQLRTTIPRLVTPLATKHKTPQSLIADYQAAIQNMNNEVREFREIMTGEEGKKVLDYAKEKGGGVVRPWVITEHPGWSIRDS